MSKNTWVSVLLLAKPKSKKKIKKISFYTIHTKYMVSFLSFFILLLYIYILNMTENLAFFFSNS